MGMFALPLETWRGIVAGRQASTARQGLLNERYQKGAEMPGSEVLSVRLGGIYALQRLAEESPGQYHIQIMRLFCAFVRLPTRTQSLESGQAAIEPGSLLGIRHDVEAVKQMIGFRDKSRITLERKADFRLDLRSADLPKAQFLGADLSNAMFHNSNLPVLKQVNIAPYVTGAVQPKLSQTNLKAVEFLPPPLPVCDAFASQISPLFQQMRSRDDESHTLATQRDALLPRLVSGEVRAGDRASKLARRGWRSEKRQNL